MAEDLVGIAYDLASAAMSVPLTPATRSPPPSKLQIPPPEKIVDKVLQRLKWFHMPGDSERAYPPSMRSQFTLSSYCGRYTFSLEERIVGRQKPGCKSGQIVRRPARRKRGSRAPASAEGRAPGSCQLTASLRKLDQRSNRALPEWRFCSACLPFNGSVLIARTSIVRRTPSASLFWLCIVLLPSGRVSVGISCLCFCVSVAPRYSRGRRSTPLNGVGQCFA